jgi:hypothetical protein
VLADVEAAIAQFGSDSPAGVTLMALDVNRPDFTEHLLTDESAPRRTCPAPRAVRTPRDAAA